MILTSSSIEQNYLSYLCYSNRGFFTGSVDGSLGERPLKEAFVLSRKACSSPKSQMSTNQKQVSNSKKLFSYVSFCQKLEA